MAIECVVGAIPHVTLMKKDYNSSTFKKNIYFFDAPITNLKEFILLYDFSLL